MVSLGHPVDVRVLKRHDSGGGLVELPVLPVSEINISRTAGGGEGTVSIGAEELRQIVANFGQQPGPVPVGFGRHAEDRSGPQPAFIEAVRVDGDSLWASLDLNAWAFGQLIEDRAFRAFSVEIQKNPKFATAELEGWVLTGGTFTNRPATDVNFKVAAEGEASCDVAAVAVCEFGSELKEHTMPEKAEEKTVSLSFHETKLAEAKGETDAATSSVKSLETRLEVVRDESAKIKADLVELSGQVESVRTERDSDRAKSARLELTVKALTKDKTSLETQLTEQGQALREATQASLSIEVRDVITAAIEAGAPPAIFEGFEANPAEWMESKYASFEAFKDTTSRLHGVGVKLSSAPVKSGHDPATAADPKDEKVTEEEAAILERFGGDAFVGVTNKAEAVAIRAKLAAAKKE